MGILEKGLASIIQVVHAVRRADSWVNEWTGTALGQGRTNFQQVSDVRLDDATLESIFYSEGFGARICTSVPEEANRRGFAFRTGDVVDDETLHGIWDQHHLTAKVVEGWSWARCFGGGAILMGIDDGREMWEPLDMNNIESVDYFATLDKRELTPVAWYDDPAGRNFGEPAIYRLNRVGAISVDDSEVHATRIVRFEGAMTSRWRRRQNNGWSESELQRVFTALQQFNGAFASVATLLQDASQGVFKVKDFLVNLASDSTDDLKKRFELMELTRGASRSIVVDADGEDFKRVEVAGLSGGGLPATLDKFMLYLAGSARIPVTVLMGQSPAGLNATGDSDMRLWYDRIASEREQYLLPRMMRIARILRAARSSNLGTTRGRFLIEYPSMYEMTPKEEADANKTQAEADKIYVDMGALEPSEVAATRFTGRRGYSRQITLDPTVKRVRLGALGQPGAPAGAHVDAEFARAMPIMDKVASRAIPRSSGIAMLTAAGMDPERAESIMGDVGRTHFTAPEADHEKRMTEMQAELARHRASRTASQSMLRRVLDANRKGVLVTNPVRHRADGEDLDPDASLHAALRLDSNSVAIMLPVPPAAAGAISIDVPERTPDPHCTLVILGTSESMSPDQIALVRAVLRTWSARQLPIPCLFSGVGRFAGLERDPVYITPSAQSLASVREDLVDVLASVGLAPSTEYGFVPHVTLAYVPTGSPMPAIATPGEPFTFERVELWIGDTHEAFPFAGASLSTDPRPISTPAG